MARTWPLKIVALLIFLITYAYSKPIFGSMGESFEAGGRLNARDRGVGAQCPSPLLSTVALNVAQDPPGEYRICCPESTPDGMKIVDDIACCKHVTDAEHPEGCTIAAGTFVFPASVKGCDKGWKKKDLKGIKYCYR